MHIKIQYACLSLEDREEISRGLVGRRSFTSIAKQLDRPTSAVSREVQRNGGRAAYRAARANRRSQSQCSSRAKGKIKLIKNTPLRAFVFEHLKIAWSPDQIAKELLRLYPLDMTMRISPEAIYQYIYVLPRGALKAELIRGLRQERKHRRKNNRKSLETRGKLANMLSIEERPIEVADRTVPGHWEGDLVLGKHKRTAVGTLVERTTRTTILVPLKARDATSVRKAYARELSKLPTHLAKTLTYDQGKEMSEHARFTIDTGIQVYFAHPSSPWERGTNENTNGLVRQFFPKGTDFSQVSRREIKRAQDLLNGRPRRSLGYRTPLEVFNQLLH